MKHLLTTIDRDKVLPKEKPIPTIGYMGDMPEIVAIPTGYNQCHDDHSKLAVEIDVEETINTLFLQGDLMSGESLNDCFKRYASAIANNPNIFRLVRV